MIRTGVQNWHFRFKVVMRGLPVFVKNSTKKIVSVIVICNCLLKSEKSKSNGELQSNSAVKKLGYNKGNAL